jgi:eukaryotic-like serine/threonine-protein kinase
LPAPAASLNYGSAGIAYGLFRISCASGDGELLALADAWSERAFREIEHDHAFYNADLDLTPHTVGHYSLFHSAVGIQIARAVIAKARGDLATFSLAVHAFLNTAKAECDGPALGLDVALGSAGILLACDSLLNLSSLNGEPGGEMRESLITLGRQALCHIWNQLGRFPEIRKSRERCNLGIAHGWAGLLYAGLRWCASTGDPLPLALKDRVDQLAECAEPAGRGLQWKWELGRLATEPAGSPVPGWCNGSAGYVFLWTQAHRVFNEQKYLELAEGAAWNAWETPSPIGNLCCGSAGQAYALLNFHRHTGEEIWLERARHLAEIATEPRHERPESLFRGALGIVVLASDLEQPTYARMPIFESE